ncbi:MAG TPA: type II secretion system F family protein [Nitrososphaerales archaeon]|nr:type II secretion system F family protein [Nitrososphaerales archaeon]
MPLTRRQVLGFKLQHRFKVKRYVFTLAIPAIIGASIFVYAVYTGFAPIPFVGGTSLTPASSSASSDSASLREAAYAKIVAQLNPDLNSTGANSTQPSATTPNAPSLPNPHNFDLILLVGMGVGLAPYSADITIRGRRERKYEEDFTDFLFELSELVRGGIDPIKAIITLSQGSLGSITKPVQTVAKQMQIGYTFEQSMRNLAATLNSQLVDKYVDLVIQASYSGGSVANLIQRASSDMSTFLSIEKEKRAGLSQYMVILYAAQVILIALSAIMVVQFLPDLKSIASLGSTSFSGSILGQSDIGSVDLERDLYFLVVINGFMGGLVIGKISEGKIKYGLKHGLILMLIGFLAWTLFVIPQSSGASVTYNVNIVSFDHQGLAGLPLKDPVLVNVTDSKGQPMATVAVVFSITGPGGGAGAKLDPSSADTDSNGQASTQVTLGNSGGSYTLTASVGNNSTSVVIQATGASGGGG